VLRADAAAAWDRAAAAFGRRVILTGSWRSYETQERLFRDRYRQGNHRGKSGYTTDVRYWQGQPWTRLTGTAAAAIPGTSNHGGGVAVDVKTRRDASDPPATEAVVFTGWADEDRTAFLAAAAAHGWCDDEGRSVGEHWHITYYAERDRHRDQPAPTPPTQTPTTPHVQADDMRDLIAAIYRVELLRNATPTELDYWLVQAASRQLSAHQVWQEINGSREGVLADQKKAAGK
jgi:hypothetical protein